MQQDPYKLLNDIHERISKDDTEQLILSDYDPNPSVWGYSKWWLFIVGSPALVTLFITARYLTGPAKLYGFGATVVFTVLAGIITAASPSDMDARSYFTAVVSHHFHQKEMIRDSDPDESRLEQPKNDSLPGRIARSPLVRDWPIIGTREGDYNPTQELVAHKRPFRDGYAILRDDGSLIGAIHIQPIALRLESLKAKQKVERAFANALESAIDYDAEIFEPTRVANFETRRSQWEARARTYQSAADRFVNGYDDVSIRKQILSDIASERAAGINLYEKTKRVRDHYILVSVDPDEVVIDRSESASGLGSITGVGELVKLKRLREQAGTDEHISNMVDKLERRVDNLESELGRIDGLSANAMSAVEFSEAVADFYRGTNVYAHDDFTQCIRGSPVPGKTAHPGDPEHDVSYQHITNRDRAGSPPSPSPSPTSVHAADGGVQAADETDTAAGESAPSAAPPEPTVEDDRDSVDVLNEDTLVGLAEDEEELSWRYKTTLAPYTHKRHPTYCELDDEYLTRTLEITDWPARPAHGFFDPLTSFQMPSVDVAISTHLSSEDSRKTSRELAEDADSLKDKVKRLARNKWIPDLFVREAGNEYGKVKRTQNTVESSEYGLYTSHSYVEIRAPTEKKLNKAESRIQSRMQEVSADAKPLKYHHRLGYQTVAPACKDFIGGKTKMSGKGLSRMIPWTARNLIEPDGIELGLNEDTGDPIVLDLQNRETGFNIGIWGTIGSGKTTTLTRLLLRLKMRNPEMPLVIIDPKQEFAGLTWLFDGEAVKIGSDTGINPLQIEETPPEKLDDDEDEGPYRKAVRRAMDFVRSYYEYQGLPFENVQGTWRDAIQEAYRRRGITKNPTTHDNPSPTLKDDVFPIFVEMVKTPENFVNEALTDVETSTDRMQDRADEIIHNHVGALQEDGEFEHLSMETDIDIENIDVLYLDLQNYENEVTAGLMMGPVLTAVLEQAKAVDEPMALAMDEFHYMLQNSSSLETLKQAYRHSRHSDLSMITATQSVEEFFTENDEGEKQLTESASTLTKLMSVKIWHYLEEMNDEWAGEFDMSDAEQSHIEDADTGDPTAQALLQLQKGGSYRLQVDYSDEKNPREFAMNLYDPTESDHGTDPLAYLSGYTDRQHRDVCEWTWIESRKANQSPIETDDEQPTETQNGTELVDGRTVTTDISDVDATPSAEADDEDENEDVQESGESAAESESDIKPAAEVIEETASDEEEPDGIAARLRPSVGGTSTDATEDEDEGPSLTDIGTVTARTASDLEDAGFETVEEVYLADLSALAEVDGFNEDKADFVHEQAAEALGVPEDAPDPDSESSSKTADSETDPDAETDAGADADAESDSDESTPESEQEPDDKPTATVEFTPGEEPTDSESGADPDSDTEPDDSDDSVGIAARMKDSLGSMFSHSAAGKSHPDHTDIGGAVDEQKAAVLRNAGFETVEEIYLADPSALAEIEGIDETHAGYIQSGAEQALHASEASIPERTDESEAETADEDGSEAIESTDQPAEDSQPSESAPDDENADVDDTAAGRNGDEPTELALTDIREVGDNRADDLRAAGYESVADVAAVGHTTLTEVEGVGEARAETMSASASDLLEHSEATVADAPGDD